MGLEKDVHFMTAMKKLGLKVLGLPDDKLDWITTKLTTTHPSNPSITQQVRSGGSGGGTFSSGIHVSVEHTARIPKDFIGDVSIVSDPAALLSYVDGVKMDVERASGKTYGL